MTAKRRQRASARWRVVCPAYSDKRTFASEESARRVLAGIERLGACQETHRVEEVK